jgi:hydroxypyruvate isomerase
MDRRSFAQVLAGSLLGASALRETIFASEESNAVAHAGGKSELPFKLSVMLWTVFTHLPFEQRLEKVAEAGYRNVELVGEYEKWTPEDFQRANAKRKELGITFDSTAGLKHGVCNPGDRKALLDELRQALVTMEAIGCSSMILLSGNKVPGMSPETQHQSCIDCLKEAAAMVEGKKINGEPVRLLLETIDPEENPKCYLTSVAEGFEIVKAVNHPQVQLLYDFFHEQIAEGNLIEKLEKNIEHLGLVHVADVPGRHAPGTGEINYGNIFGKLAELKYNYVVAMEFLPLGDPVTELRVAREMALRTAGS